MTTLDDLAAAAEKATPGPWWTPEQDADPAIVYGPDGDEIATVQGNLGKGQDASDNARFIALADPTTVLRLVAVVRAADSYSPERDHDWRCEYRTAEAGWQPGDSPVIRCECGYDELQAALAALRKESGDA